MPLFPLGLVSRFRRFVACAWGPLARAMPVRPAIAVPLAVALRPAIPAAFTLTITFTTACDGGGGCPEGTVAHGDRCVPAPHDAADDGGDGGCEGGACTTPCVPSGEACDGTDNDCDSIIDEGVMEFGSPRELFSVESPLLELVPDKNGGFVAVSMVLGTDSYVWAVQRLDSMGAPTGPVEPLAPAPIANLDLVQVFLTSDRLLILYAHRSDGDHGTVASYSFPELDDEVLLTREEGVYLGGRLRKVGGAEVLDVYAPNADPSTIVRHTLDVATLAGTASELSYAQGYDPNDLRRFLAPADAPLLGSSTRLDLLRDNGIHVSRAVTDPAGDVPFLGHAARGRADGQGFLYVENAAAIPSPETVVHLFDNNLTDTLDAVTLESAPASATPRPYVISETRGSWFVLASEKDWDGSLNDASNATSAYTLHRIGIADDKLRVVESTPVGTCSEPPCEVRAFWHSIQPTEYGVLLARGVSDAAAKPTVYPYGCLGE